MKIVVLILSIIFPLFVNADYTLGYGRKPGSTTTDIVQYFNLEGSTAYCIDQHIPNPKNLTSKAVYSAYDGVPFANGFIAMFNYSKTVNNEDALYDALRAYTYQVDGRYTTDGVTRKCSQMSGVRRDICNVGINAYNGDTTYLPGSSSSSSSDSDEPANFTLKVIDKSDLNNIKVQINFNGDKPSWFKMPSTCSSSNNDYSCSMVSGLNSDNTFSFRLSGNSKTGGSVTASFNFDGSTKAVNTSGMIDTVSIYECPENNKYTCNSTWNPIFGYQRFVVAGGDSSSGSGGGSGSGSVSVGDSDKTKKVTITIPGLCDTVDPSTLIEDSKEEDEYIKSCGPIVHLENDCGANSCDESGSSYLDFSHSYVRRRSLKYIMLDLDSGLSDDLTDYLDESINNYCGIYSTSKTDIFTPGTATAISGQFFIFNQYNSTDYSNENTYFRQPYIVERVKSAFFFDYNKWVEEYKIAVDSEENAYNAWQSAVKAVAPAYNSYTSAQSSVSTAQSYINTQNLTYCGKYDSTTKKTVYDSSKCQQRLSSAQAAQSSAYSAWQSAVNDEKTKLNAYKTAVTKRTNLQAARNTCMQKESEFKSSTDYNLDDIPDVDFTYSQTSKKEGEKEYTINMVNNEEKTKYWPNVTSDDSISDYLGESGANLDKNTAKQSIDRHSIRELNPNIASRNGVYLSGETGTTASYSFPDATHDNCGGGTEMCTTYDYTTLSFNSIQGSTSASDPYGNVSTSSNETISKIYFYRPENATFALMNTGEYKTLDYQSNASYTNINGLEIGYVYNIELTAYKGQYSTSFTFNNVGYKAANGKHPAQELINNYISSEGLSKFESVCNYCNMEMAFKRNCDVCDPGDPGSDEFVPQFYYRSISLADVTPNEREEDATNWSDDKGKAAKSLIEQGSLYASLTNNVLDNNDYIALTDKLDNIEKDGESSVYLADSSSTGKYDIYNDISREYLEYEVTLSPYDMKNIKRNNSRSYFSFSKMNMCNGAYSENPGTDDSTSYCFECNSDMKECKSTFINAYFDKDTTDRARREKWKYYVNGKFCTGNINTCIKGISYTEDGKYPDPLFTQQFIEKYKNWP